MGHGLGVSLSSSCALIFVIVGRIADVTNFTWLFQSCIIAYTVYWCYRLSFDTLLWTQMKLNVLFTAMTNRITFHCHCVICDSQLLSGSSWPLSIDCLKLMDG